MKKRMLIKYMLLTLLAIMLATGCSKSVEIQDVPGGAEDVDSQYEQEDESVQEDTLEEADNISGQTPVEQKGSITEPVEQKEVASVIVKSENNMSDSEKQEIIDQLSKEVDDLLNEINSVE